MATTLSEELAPLDCMAEDAILAASDVEAMPANFQEPPRRCNPWLRAMAASATIVLLVVVGVVGWRAASSAVAQEVSGPRREQPQQLWYEGNWQPNWHDGKVPCGWAQCDCGWASVDPGNQCGKVDSPRSPCWSCCCSRLYPELYRQALRYRGRPRGGSFRGGQYGDDDFYHEDGHRRSDRSGDRDGHEDRYEDEDEEEEEEDEDRWDGDRGEEDSEERWSVGEERYGRSEFQDDPFFRDERYMDRRSDYGRGSR